MLNKIAISAGCIFLAGCSSLNSIDSPGEANGLTYYLPKKDFQVTITVANNEITQVALGTTPAYPDLTKRFVLNFGSNYFGENTLDVSINSNGLLTSSKSTTVSDVNEFAKSLGTAAGYGTRILGPVNANPCMRSGDHIFIFSDISTNHDVCGVTISVSRIPITTTSAPTKKVVAKAHSGIFYRQNEPYLMKAEGPGINLQQLVFSPSLADTAFLPVKKTFFADNEAEFTFTDGVPTKYKQNTSGEAIALIKLPADIFSAYFAAIGSVFDAFKTNDTKEKDALTQSMKLELAKLKYDACIKAIAAKDNDTVKSLECEKIN